MSLAGRCTLAQSVLSTMSLYAMQTMRVLARTCDELEKATRTYLWGGSEEQRRMSMVNWPSFLKPKVDGGIGLRPLQKVNTAFGMKMCWELFMKPESFWAKVLCAKYKFDPRSEFPPIARGSCSSAWKMICDNWDSMKGNVVWSLGAADMVRFWLHAWLPGVQNMLSEFALGPIPQSMLHKTVAYFVDVNGDWKWSLFERLLPADILLHIGSISPPCSSQGADTPLWSLSASGCFTLKSAYSFLIETQCPSVNFPWRLLWRWQGP